MVDAEIPKVAYLKPLQADNAGQNADVLTYETLHDAVIKNAEYNGRRVDVFMEQEPASIEELARARQLAFEYWVATADKLVDSSPKSRDLWADRYTNASVELFGAPDAAEATREVARQSESLEELHDNPVVDQQKLHFVLTEYNQITHSRADVVHDETDIRNEAHYRRAVKELQGIINKRYGSVMDLVDTTKDAYTQQELTGLFEKALKILAETDDDAWSQWRVTHPKSGTAVMVDGKEHEIRVPAGRSAVDPTEAKKLLAHEIFTHALRAKNGEKHENPRMLKGFPNFLDGEEGLAILMGAAGSDGKVSDRTHDRYIDIAMAMGLIGEHPKQRHELFELAYARQYVRMQARGETIDEDKLRKQTSVYVDRIYRGSPGDTIGSRQAVYTADIYYYRYKDIANYIAEQLEVGHTMDDIFDYLMQGKFDPTNPMHTREIGQLSAR
jgi:hypothetical protein